MYQFHQNMHSQNHKKFKTAIHGHKVSENGYTQSREQGLGVLNRETPDRVKACDLHRTSYFRVGLQLYCFLKGLFAKLQQYSSLFVRNFYITVVVNSNQLLKI